MKKLFFLLLFFCVCLGSSAQELATRRASFGWEYDPAALATVSTFKLYVIQQLPNNVQTNVASILIPATNTVTTVSAMTVLGSLPNGVYGLYATAIGNDIDFGGLESEPTDVLWVFWYARPPKPGQIVFIAQ